MTKRLRKIFAAMLLVLCVILCISALWLRHRSATTADFLYYNDRYAGHNWLEATSEVGGLELTYEWLKGWSTTPGFSHGHYSIVGFEESCAPFLNAPPWHVTYMGFGVGHIFYTPSHNPQYAGVWHNEYSIYLPCWFIALMFLLYPIYTAESGVKRWTRRAKDIVRNAATTCERRRSDAPNAEGLRKTSGKFWLILKPPSALSGSLTVMRCASR